MIRIVPIAIAIAFAQLATAAANTVDGADPVLLAQAGTSAEGAAQDPMAAIAREREAWEAVMNETDPNAILDFLEAFPDGIFAATARAQLRRMIAAPAEAGTPPRAPEATPAASGVDEAAADTASPPAAPVEPIGDPIAGIQTELIRLGCLSGRADGIWGPMSRAGLERYAAQRGVAIGTLALGSDLHRQLIEETDRVCPVIAAAPRAEPRRSSARPPAAQQRRANRQRQRSHILAPHQGCSAATKGLVGFDHCE